MTTLMATSVSKEDDPEKFNLKDVFEKTYSETGEFIKLETMTQILSYRGEINVSLYNTSHKEFVVNIGDRIAQMGVKLVPQIQFQ